jgi:hypothetical protein
MFISASNTILDAFFYITQHDDSSMMQIKTSKKLNDASFCIKFRAYLRNGDDHPRPGLRRHCQEQLRRG